MIRLEPLGDRAFLARFGSAEAARGWFLVARGAALRGVVDVVLAFRDVTVFVAEDFCDFDQIERSLHALTPILSDSGQGVVHLIPVLYDGADLGAVAQRLQMSVAELIRLHQEPVYDVLAIGFLPGFPYAGPLPEPLAGLPRRDQPRPRVPVGSVAIVGRQTGIYPQESPGGWQLLGRTPLRTADPEAGHFPIQAGDRLRFAAISKTHYGELAGRMLARGESR